MKNAWNLKNNAENHSKIWIEDAKNTEHNYLSPTSHPSQDEPNTYTDLENYTVYSYLLKLYSFNTAWLAMYIVVFHASKVASM